MNYKFKPDDKVKIMSYTGAEDGFPVTVYAAYTSDKENHPAAPHNRYVCFDEERGITAWHLHDVSENELELIK